MPSHLTDQPSPPLDVQAALHCALRTIDRNLVTFATLFPDDTTTNNVYQPRRPRGGQPLGSNFDWTPGFWTGMLWLAYELTGDERYRQGAEQQLPSYVDRLDRKIYVNTHDLGFLYTLSCVAPWRLTGNPTAREAALAAADLLMVRYLDTTGIIQAWGDLDDPQQRGRAIIDSLMNMPLLYWATEVSGDGRCAAAARRHAAQLREYMARPDNTTYHTFYWDPATGAPLGGKTAQGYADDSCWARGQAWAIYGFALNYRHTEDPALLHAASACADYFLAHLPADYVPYWDLVFTDGSSEERDSSAAAIAVCGLQEIIHWLPDGPQRERYAAAAGTILASLAENYATCSHPESNALILHGVYGKPQGSGVDEGNLWGDYFYLEALARAIKPEWQPYW